jgi:hypothetical protein
MQMKTTKVKKQSALKPLEKGQLWQLKDTHLEIVDMGKRLTHYRLLPGLKQKGVPVRLGGIEEVQKYLKANKAKLIKN